MDRKIPLRRSGADSADQLFWTSRALDSRKSEFEPRQSPRRALDVRALINHGLTYSVSWRVRDLSLTGAFVEMDVSQLPDGRYVEFVLRYRYKDENIENRIAARVTRIEADGVALEFGPYDDQIYTDLNNLLYAL